MSTAVLTGRPPVTAVPFGRLVRTELRKLTDTRAGRWLLGFVLAATPLAAAGALFFSDPKTLTFSRFVDFAQTPQKFLLPILAVLSVTSEWSQRTGLITFTLEPDRKRVLLAKALATLSLGAVVYAITLSSAALGNVLAPVLRDGDGSWASGAGVARDIGVVLLGGLAQGFACGMLLMVSAAAIVAFFVVPGLSGVLFGTVSALKDAGPWLDFNMAQGALYEHALGGREWGQVGTSLLLWVVLPGVVGAVRVLRAEIKAS